MDYLPAGVTNARELLQHYRSIAAKPHNRPPPKIEPPKIEPPAPIEEPKEFSVADLALHRLVEEAKELVDSAQWTPDKPHLRVRDIIRAVSGFYKVSYADLLAHRREMQFIFPRHMAMFLAKALTLRSLPEIGREFDGREHTTVLNACHRIRQARDASKQVRSEMTVLARTLVQHFSVPVFDGSPTNEQIEAALSVAGRPGRAAAKRWDHAKTRDLLRASGQTNDYREMVTFMNRRGHHVTIHGVKKKLRRMASRGELSWLS